MLCVFSGRGLCDELITRPEESYRLCCVVCDLETSRIGAPYIYDISNLRVNNTSAWLTKKQIKFVVNRVLLCVLIKSWCGVPEDGYNSGTCRS